MKSHSKNTVKSANDLKFPIVLSDGTHLPLLMVRADVLVPILGLDELEEELALDLHYSLEKERVWELPKLKHAANLIYNKLLSQEDGFSAQIKERLPECDPEVTTNQWIIGFEYLLSVDNRKTLSWERL